MVSGMGGSRRTYPVGAQRLRLFDYADPDAVYFVTICVEGRRSVFIEPSLARIVLDCLTWLRTNRGVVIYALCLMPDHLHLLVRPGQSLGAIIRMFKTYTTRQVQARGGAGKLWQDDYYEHIIRKDEDARGIARYILDNPVRKGLVAAAEDYPWSELPDPM
jgi:REP element-mobilizing transposase RayT